MIEMVGPHIFLFKYYHKQVWIQQGTMGIFSPETTSYDVINRQVTFRKGV